jgi:dihydroflavonol-4-reductase
MGKQGGTGFIGANLMRLLLAQGYQVGTLILPHSNLDNLQGLNDENLFKLMGGCESLTPLVIA